MKLELRGDNERGQAGTHDHCGSAGRRRCHRRLRLGKIRFIISIEDKMLSEGRPLLGMNADHRHLTRHPGGHVTGWGPVPTPGLEQLWRFCSLHIVCPGSEARPNSPLPRLPWCSSPSGRSSAAFPAGEGHSCVWSSRAQSSGHPTCKGYSGNAFVARG